MKHTIVTVLIVFGLLSVVELANAAGSAVPEPFQGFDEDSKHTIRYDDLSGVLNAVVINVGKSTRERAAPSQAAIGTRMKASVKRSTVNEGNRFYYETFDKNEESQQLLRAIQTSLEQLPLEVPLKFFSRDEQLAYWLNLYNVTLLNEIIKVYPKRNLKKVLVGKKSILSKKILNVAGVPLSLDDIQYTILKNNYDNDPLIIYGLYQGIIGGPNIRKKAYTGSDVRRALKNNANEFINSNRGTYSKDEKVFQVSSLYDRNRVFFPDFKSDLKEHLLTYLDQPERSELQSASTLKPNIDDWTVTDLGGTTRDLGASFADSNAALLDSVRSTVAQDGGGTLGASVGAGSSSMAAKAKPLQRIDPELLTILHELNLKRETTNVANATVTLEELGEFPVEPKADPDTEKKDDN